MRNPKSHRTWRLRKICGSRILAQLKKKKAADAIKTLQLAAIAVFIPIFFLFVIFLSKTKVTGRVVEFLGVVGLLLTFEFITDLAFPYISDWTGDSPLWEMVILVAIAASLEPLNYKVENWIKTKLAKRLIPQHAGACN